MKNPGGKKAALDSADEGQTEDGQMLVPLRCVYTHSTDMDTWRRTCSVVSQLTHYSTTYQQLGQLKKIKTVGERFSLTSDRTTGGISFS